MVTLGVHRYFEQYGVCALCPTAQSPASILASVGFPLLLAAVVGALVALRAMMARGMMKVSCWAPWHMMQARKWCSDFQHPYVAVGCSTFAS